MRPGFGNVRHIVAACLLVGVGADAAAQISSTQSACVDGLNKQLAGVAKVQQKQAVDCVKFAALGQTSKLGKPGQTLTAQACLTNDVKGTLAKAVAKVTAEEQKKCLARPEQLPPFGHVPSATSFAAARAESLALMADLFGPDLDATLVRSTQDRAGAACQAFVLKQTLKVHAAIWKLLLATKKSVLKCSQPSRPASCAQQGLPVIGSSGELADALAAAVDADVNGTIARAVGVLVAKAASTCAGTGTPLASLFPAGCREDATPGAIGACAEAIVRGRACRMLNAVDGLSAACPRVPGHEPDIAAPSRLELGLIGETVAVEGIVTVTNVGTEPLVIDDVALQGSSAFTLATSTPPPLSIPPGGALPLPVRFQPPAGTAGTAQTATLRIDSDDPDEAQIDVTLTGDVVTNRPPPAGVPVAGVRVTGDVITPATCTAVDVEVQLTAATQPGDVLSVRLADQAGGSVVAPSVAAGTGPRALTVSGLDACALADGVVTPSVVVTRGAVDLPAVPGRAAVKNTSPLAPPVLDPLPYEPFVTLVPEVRLCGTARTDTTITVSGAASTAPVSTSPDGTFCIDVPLRRNQSNLLIVTATDDLAAPPRPRASALPIEVIHLDLDEAVFVDVTSRPLSTAEIEALVAAGVIDLGDAANYNVSEFTLVFSVGGRLVSMRQVVPTPAIPGTGGGSVSYGIAPLPGGGSVPGGGAVGDSPIARGGWTPRADLPGVVLPPPPSAGGCRSVCSQVVVVTGPDGESSPGVIVMDGRIKTLKEFFQIGISLTNRSPMFAMADVAARVVVPGGLTPVRAGLGTDPTTVDLDGAIDAVDLGAVAPGGHRSAQFIVRGDQIGVHPVTVELNGFFAGPPLPAPIPFGGSVATTVEVLGPPELGVLVRHPTRPGLPDVLLNEVYSLLIEITNLSDRPALYTSIELFLGGNAILVDENDQPLPNGADVRSVGHIQSGQTVSLIYRVRSLVQGDVIACQGVASENVTLSVDTGPEGSACDVAGTIPSGIDDLPPELPPTVSAIVPANGAVDVDREAGVVALLAPRSACLIGDTFTNVVTAPIVPGGGLQVVAADLVAAGTYRLDAIDAFGRPAEAVPTELVRVDPPAGGTTIATLRLGLAAPPSQAFLRPDTTYRAMLVGGPGGVCSAASGAELASTVAWTFSTGRTCDGPAPTVTLRDPQDGATERPIDQAIVVEFSGAIDPGTLTGDSFQVVQGGVVASGDVVGGSPIAGVTTFEDGTRTLRFRASAPLPTDTAIHVRLTNALADACGLALATPAVGVRVFSFTTAPPDGTPPAPPVVDPLPVLTNALQIAVTGTAEAGSTVRVDGGSAPASTTAGASGLFAVSVPLVTDATNDLSVQATDAAGNPSPAVTLDRTGAPLQIEQDATPPAVTSITPPGGADGVLPTAPITVVFDEGIRASSANTGNVTVTAAGTVSGTIAMAGSTGFTFTPSVPFPANAVVTVRLRAGGVRDVAGNALPADVVSTFTVSGGPPIVTAIVPSSGLQGTVVTAQIQGQNLAAVSSVGIDGSGVTVTDLGTGSPTTRNVRFVIAASAPIGPRSVTITTPSGTAAGTFTVTDTTVPATIEWVAPGGGSWHVASNWLPARVPLPTDDVRISATGTVTLSMPATVRSLVLFSDLAVTGASLSLSGGVSPALVVHASGGITMAAATTVTVQNGLTLNGTATLTGTNTVNPARLEFDGGQVVDGTGTIAFASGNDFPATNFVRPVGGGLVTLGNGLTIRGGSGTLGGPSGTFRLLGTVHPDTAGRTIALGGLIANAGDTFSILAGPGLFNLQGGSVQNAVVVGTGTLSADGTTGSLETVRLDANLSIGAAGLVTVRTGLTLNGTATLTGTNTVNPARLEFDGGQVVDGTGTIAFASGNDFPATNFVRPVGGGLVTLGNGLTIRGGSGTLGGPSGTFRLLGTVHPDTAGRTIALGGLIANAGDTFSILAGPGLFNFQGGGVQNAVVVGSGTLSANGTTGSLETVRLDANLSIGAAGLVTVRTGLTLNGTATLTGTNTVNPARLEFDGGQVVDGTGTIAFASGNDFPATNFVRPVGGGLVTLGSGLTVRGGSGTLGGPNGTFRLLGTIHPDTAGRTIALGGLIANAGDTFSILAGPGLFNFQGGGVQNAVVVGSGTLSANGTTGSLETVRLDANLSIGAAGLVTVRTGLTLNGTATLTGTNTVNPARLEFDGGQVVDGTGTIAFASGNDFPATNFVRPVGGGLVTLGSGLTVRGGSGTLGGPTGTVLNLGTVNADVAGRTIIITGAGFENRGLIAATGGGLAVQTLTMNGGTIFAAAGKTVTVSGNLALGATDTVVTELAGLSNVGLLAVTGTASVAGTLDVRLATGFTPSVGQRFRIMTFASRSGLFGTLLGTDPGGGVALTLDPGDPVDFELAAVAE